MMNAVDRLWRKVRSNFADFNSWVSLLDAVEKQTNIDVSRNAFDNFLDNFPYCYGYWKKYADLERHNGNKDRSLKIFSRGVSAIPLSVDLWMAYIDATVEIIHGQDDYEDEMRNLYELALEKAGLEFRSDALWESYISWESGHNRPARALVIYDRLLRTPTQLYFQNWDSFKKLVEENRPEDILSKDEFAEFLARVSPVAGTALRIAMNDPSSAPTKKLPEITEADRSAIRQLVIDRREKIYQATYLQIMKRWYFEEKIRRPYFHVKPLEETQIGNWAEYLSFEESEAASAETLLAAPPGADEPMSEEPTSVTPEDVSLARKRVRVLYERCLVACALYEHLWIRYAKYLEYTEEDVGAAREIWRRACTVHLRAKPTIHWHWALFEDRYRASTGVSARSALEILSNLEDRLPDSALVCGRRTDAMRRDGQPLLDLVVCLRSGINRLRLRATEQASIARSTSGPTASLSAAIALATAAQARAGAGYLAGKLARLLARNVNSGNHPLVPPAGIPRWQLLLSAAYKEEKPPLDAASAASVADAVKREEGIEDAGETSENALPSKQPPAIEQAPSPPPLFAQQFPSPHSGDTGPREDEFEETDLTPESITISDVFECDADEEMNADSPPVLISRKSASETSGVEHKEQEERTTTMDRIATANVLDRVGADGGQTASKPMRFDVTDPLFEVLADSANPGLVKRDSEKRHKPDETNEETKNIYQPESIDQTMAVTTEPPPKKKRRSRWGDAEGETDKDLMTLRAAEEERMAKADRDQLQYAQERANITRIVPPSDPSLLPPEERNLISAEEAAITVLKEAIEFDPRNERLYTQLLDIAYQQRPLNQDLFLEFADTAIVDSILPATVKLAFSQRKLQFLEEFCDDVHKISRAFDEYIQLAQLVVQCTTTDSTKSALLPGVPVSGIDAPQAYSTPDLLNVTLPAPLRPSSRRNPAPNGPVRRMPQIDLVAAILKDAASVGTPLPHPPASAISMFTTGAYEPFAGPAAGGLPPPAPTMVPVAAATATADGVTELWRGLDPSSAGYANAVAATYATGGGTFYAPLGASGDDTTGVSVPPPALKPSI